MKLLVMSSLILGLLGCDPALVSAQDKAAVVQHAGDCSVNIAGNGNTASLVCKGVDPKLAEQIRAILNGSRRSEKAAQDISQKLDLLLKEINGEAIHKPSIQINSAPDGIAIAGGNVTNPTVNNYGPPQPKIVATSSPSELQPPQGGGSGMYKTKVTIKTDREADLLSFRLAFDGPYLKAEVSDSYTPTIAFSSSSGEMNGHPAFEFSITYPSTLPANGEIYVIVYSNQPVKAIQFERGP